MDTDIHSKQDNLIISHQNLFLNSIGPSKIWTKREQKMDKNEVGVM